MSFVKKVKKKLGFGGVMLIKVGQPFHLFMWFQPYVNKAQGKYLLLGEMICFVFLFVVLFCTGNRHILCTQNMWWSEIAAILGAEFKSQGKGK